MHLIKLCIIAILFALPQWLPSFALGCFNLYAMDDPSLSGAHRPFHAIHIAILFVVELVAVLL